MLVNGNLSAYSFLSRKDRDTLLILFNASVLFLCNIILFPRFVKRILTGYPAFTEFIRKIIMLAHFFAHSYL